MLISINVFKIHQRGVQWKQGVVICMVLHTSLLYNPTPIRCTPLPLHPPVMNTQTWGFHRMATFPYICHMLPTFPRESSSGGNVAPL